MVIRYLRRLFIMLNKTQREICHKVVAHMIGQLLPRFRTLNIAVNLVTIKSDAIGFCMMQETNRDFEIELDKKLGIKEMVQALCHEMVHVKQYARNEMNDGIVKGKARWKKQSILKWIQTIGIYLGKKKHIEWKRNLLMQFGSLELYDS